MPRINLGEIQFRPYSSGDDITFGPDDYTPTPGAIHLNNIKFRPWQLAILDPGTGGGVDDTGGGGGGGPGPGGAGDATPGSRGTYAMAVSSTLGSNSIDGVSQSFVGQNNVYVYAEVYVTSAAKAAMVAPTSTRFYGDIVEIIGSGGVHNDAWQAVDFTNKNASSINDGNLYAWDYWSLASQKKIITPDTWHTIEAGIRNVSGGDYETRWSVDGVFSSSWVPGPTGLTANYFEGVGAGMIAANSLVQQDWIVDNVLWCFDNFYSLGGTPASGSGFETGDFSSWESVLGSNQTIVAAP